MERGGSALCLGLCLGIGIDGGRRGGGGREAMAVRDGTGERVEIWQVQLMGLVVLRVRQRLTLEQLAHS